MCIIIILCIHVLPFQIVSTDVTMPQGIAVDYMGNNVYFSQKTNTSGECGVGFFKPLKFSWFILDFFTFFVNLSDQGRLEVVTCDGQYRKILKNDLNDPGPLALDITRG